MSSSSAAVRVEKATSELLIGPDWTLNIDICDSINSNHWLAKDVVKAVKKRLQHKNPSVQFLALTLLETMMKNCGDYLHIQVVEREILLEMVKIVKKKADMRVRDKILVLLDSWQEAFGGAGGNYPQFYWAYVDLKRSGVEFPERLPDATLLLKPSVNVTPIIRNPQVGYGMPSNSALRLDEAMASEMANLSLSDLASMQSAVDLLSEMMKAANLNDPTAVQDEVIIDLVEQCRLNQKKLMESINSISWLPRFLHYCLRIKDQFQGNADASHAYIIYSISDVMAKIADDEELLGQGLELNDNIQNLLAKHDALASGSPLPAEVSESIPSPKVSILRKPSTTNRYDDDEEDDDDDFAQLARRNSIIKSVAFGCNSIATSDQLSLPNQSDTMLSTSAARVDGASSSSASNGLTLQEPAMPVRTITEEQDVINLLTTTFSPNPAPSDSALTPIYLGHNKSPSSVPPAGLGPRSSQPYAAANQGYAPQNNYIASWAQTQTYHPSPQTQPQTELLVNPSSYPPPPWETEPAHADAHANADFNFNPFAQTTNEYPEPIDGASAVAYTSMHASVVEQNYNSFGTTINNVPATRAETEENAGNGHTGKPTAHQPYVYTNRLFNDLLDLRNSSSGLNTNSPNSTMSEAFDRGMLNDRK